MMNRLDHEKLMADARFSSTRTIRPFLRWAGSKRRLLPQIIPHLPAAYNRYYELFLGGGSLSTLLAPTRATLSDTSPELMNCWRQVSEHPQEIVDRLSSWPLDRARYYDLRAQSFSDPIDSAAKFIYMNKGAFNGLYRVNRRGEFNVPWGAPKSGNVVDEASLFALSSWLRSSNITLGVGSFERFLSHATRGDLVFLDPPYHSVSEHQRDFRHYNKTLFSWGDQVRLANLAEKARQRGAHVLITNSVSQDVRDLYPSFDEYKISQHSTMAAGKEHRMPVREALYVGHVSVPTSA